MKKIQYVKLAQTKTLAKKMSPKLKGGEILALCGPLGSGKTTFTKALGKTLGIKKIMPSPTFVLMHSYGIKLKEKKAYFFHLDFYRAKNFNEIKALGLEQIWGKKENLSVIEWGDKFKTHLPKKTIFINFSHE